MFMGRRFGLGILQAPREAHLSIRAREDSTYVEISSTCVEYRPAAGPYSHAQKSPQPTHKERFPLTGIPVPKTGNRHAPALPNAVSPTVHSTESSCQASYPALPQAASAGFSSPDC